MYDGLLVLQVPNIYQSVWSLISGLILLVVNAILFDLHDVKTTYSLIMGNFKEKLKTNEF